MPIMTMAEEVTGTVDITAIKDALTAGLGNAATQTVEVMGLIAPYGITIFVAILAVKYAKKFFQKISG